MRAPGAETARADRKFRLRFRAVSEKERLRQPATGHDPNGLQLEYCHLTRALDADDAVPRVRFRRDGRKKLPVEGSDQPV